MSHPSPKNRGLQHGELPAPTQPTAKRQKRVFLEEQIEEIAKRVASQVADECRNDAGEVDDELADAVLDAVHRRQTKKYASDMLAARMVNAVGERWGGRSMKTDRGRVAYRVLVHDAVRGTGNDGETIVHDGEKTMAKKILKCGWDVLKEGLAMGKPDQPVAPTDERLQEKLRQDHANALPCSLQEAVSDWYLAHSRYSEVDKLLELQFCPEVLWQMFNRFHDNQGNFYPKGTDDHLQWSALEWDRYQREDGTRVDKGTPEYERLKETGAPRPSVVGRTKFFGLKPAGVHIGKDRSCCCQQCGEMEDMLDVWAMRMLAAHDPSGKHRTTDSAMKVPECTDPTCPWLKPDLNGTIPFPFRKHFKNDIVDHDQWKRTFPSAERSPPFLFCGPCQCGACCDKVVSGTEYPPYLKCRHFDTGNGPPPDELKCDDCGWFKKYPRCPTLDASDLLLDWRCLEATATKHLPDQRYVAATTKSRIIIDQLGHARTRWDDFSYTLEQRMTDWVTHNYVHRHQQSARKRAIQAVGAAKARTKLVLLIDWSEKFSLTPPNSGTGTKYPKIGLLDVVCVYKPEEGAATVCSAHPVLFESKTNDVPHTHAGLRKVLQYFATKFEFRELQNLLVFSDGGQAHFKCAEGLRDGCHLQTFARGLFGPQVVLVWNFFQSYHGKGPYDAEGGIIKYYLRAEMRRMGRAFRDAKEAFNFLRAHKKILVPEHDAHSHLKDFCVVFREPSLVLEASLPKVSSYKVRAARVVDRPAGSIRKAFSVEFDDLPCIVSTTVKGKVYGIASVNGRAEPPYSPASLCPMPEVKCTGRWRAMTCDCVGCVVLSSGKACTSHGVGHGKPAPWLRWQVSGSPAKEGAAAWLAKQFHLYPHNNTTEVAAMCETLADVVIADFQCYTSRAHCQEWVLGVFDEQ